MIFPRLLIDFVAFFGLLLTLVSGWIAIKPLSTSGALRMRVVAIFFACAALILGKLGVSDDYSIPDSAEYFATASRLLNDGKLELDVNGVDVPSRYAPWFSLFYAYPVLRVGGDYTALPWIVVLFALIGVVGAIRFFGSYCTDWVKQRDAAVIAGLVGIALLFLPAFSYFSRHLLTDLPSAAIALLLLCLYVQKVNSQWSGVLASALLIGVATGLRPLNAFLLLPFLIRSIQERKFLHLLILCVPLVGIAALQLSLQGIWFDGDILRTGYQLWMSVPYDCLKSVFSTRYLSGNLAVLFADSAFVLLFIIAFFPARFFEKKVLPGDCYAGLLSTLGKSQRFIALGLLPAALIHLFYFYPTIRFFLSLEVCCAVLALSRLGGIYALFGGGRGTLPLFFASCLLAVAFSGQHSNKEVKAQDVVSNINRLQTAGLPDDAVIVSELHPMLVQELLIRGSRRELLPLSRKVELASKILAWQKVQLPNCEEIAPRDHRSVTAQRYQPGTEAYPHTALENQSYLQSLLLSGRRLFISSELSVALISPEEGNIFTTRPYSEGVSELLSAESAAAIPLNHKS